MVPATNLIKGPFTVYARRWAGKNEGWATSNSGQSEGGGGGGVINKSAHKEGGWGYPIFYFCFIFKQILSELSGRTVHVLQAS